MSCETSGKTHGRLGAVHKVQSMKREPQHRGSVRSGSPPPLSPLLSTCADAVLTACLHAAATQAVRQCLPTWMTLSCRPAVIPSSASALSTSEGRCCTWRTLSGTPKNCSRQFRPACSRQMPQPQPPQAQCDFRALFVMGCCPSCTRMSHAQ